VEVKPLMSNDQHDFAQFMKQREEAARAYVNGDASPLSQIPHGFSRGLVMSKPGSDQTP
jgi:hypothetical protein